MSLSLLLEWCVWMCVTSLISSQMVLQNVEKAQIKVRMKKDNIVGISVVWCTSLEL